MELSAIEADLAAVDRALRRLDDGSYGRCGTCGTPIDSVLLQMNPLIESCPAHSIGTSLADEKPAQTASASIGVAST